MESRKNINGSAESYSPNHEPDAPQAATEVDSQEVATDMSRRVPYYTQLPNWLMPILFAVLFAFFTFVYTTVDRRIEDKQRAIDKLEERVAQQETYTKNSREWLIGHGWTVDDEGKVTKKPKGK